MSGGPITVLLIDDEPGMIEALTIGLEARNVFRVRSTTDPRALDKFLDEELDVVLTDVRMPEVDGMSVLARVRERLPGVEVILMTAYSSIARAVTAIKEGAFDYVPKPFDVDEVAHKLQQASRMRRLQREVDRLRATLDDRRGLGGLIGRCRAVQTVRELIERTALSHLPVLITGESGTGKELAARALHDLSPRVSKPFLALNCAAVPEALLESELFGHVKGAFSGADADHPGLIAAADGGTLLLDEIGDMSTTLQAKLLRVLEDGEIRPVGGVKARAVDVRFIASTNHDLQEDIAEGHFRKDLYYRLNAVTISMPPLRHHCADIPLLAQHALDKAAAQEGRTNVRFTPAAMELLEDYTWPGNVRELFATVERALVLSRDDVIDIQDLPESVRKPRGDAWPTVGSIPSQPLVSLDAAMSRYIEAVLRHTDGNVTAAAQILQLPRTTLISRMERLGLQQHGEGE